MQLTHRRLSVLAVLLAVVAVLVAMLPATSAKADVVYTFQYRGVSKTYVDQVSGDWVHCNYITKAKYTQTAGCTKGKTVATQVSTTYGYSDGEISAAVGFSVTYSTTVTATNSVTIKPGGAGWFSVGFRISRYTIRMENRTCTHGTCGAWSSPSSKITVQHHLGNTFHYFGTGAA